MNVYDFDKTIYDGDSTFNFYKFCLKKKPWLIFRLWRVFVPFAMYLLGKGTKTAFKEKIFQSFQPKIDSEKYLSEFWKTNVKKIKKFYLDTQREDDIIISASPYFIVKPCIDMLGIKYLYASNVDEKTGKYDGINCHGEEKVRRFEEAGFCRNDIEEFYSDSLSDSPLAEISKKAFVVSGEKLTPWNDYKLSTTKSFLKNIFEPRFLRFLMCGGISCLFSFVVTYLASHIMPNFRIDFHYFHMSNIVFAHFLGYVLSLPVSYLLNSRFSFCQKISLKKCCKFLISYIPNYIIQMLVVFLTVDILHFDKLIGLILAVLIGTPVTFVFMKFFAFREKDIKGDSK
ncbi:MAG: HAD-IB family phosphatase [Clostridia bacterium]|nr:HAD-IB family phosphatase [Clostridia bacterium]